MHARCTGGSGYIQSTHIQYMNPICTILVYDNHHIHFIFIFFTSISLHFVFILLRFYALCIRCIISISQCARIRGTTNSPPPHTYLVSFYVSTKVTGIGAYMRRTYEKRLIALAFSQIPKETNKNDGKREA